ncbi:MAG: hypothetical protein ACR2QF_06125 [Geminicoccaceae bacterium]
MRRPRSTSDTGKSISAQGAVPASVALKSVGVWYVAVIAVLLLVAAGVYIVHLHQERLEWQDAANQTSIGQELLRVDRDQMLQNVQTREADLLNLEQTLSEREKLIASLENERNDLSANLAKLTQDPTEKGQRLQAIATEDEDLPDIAAAAQKPDGDQPNFLVEDTRIGEQEREIKRLEMSLAETGELLVQYQSNLREQETLAKEARLDKSALQKEVTRLREEFVETKEAFRRGQIIRGHHASLGEVKPYLADVGPEYWQVIENWLKDKLQRDMAIPDLSAVGWSYEGARLLVTVGGPSMVMLLYADQEGSPISLTIAQDLSGIKPSDARQQAGLNLIEWHDHSHAFVLAGESDDVVLQVVASALQDQVDEISAGRTVPSGRFFRPEFRPRPSESQSSG